MNNQLTIKSAATEILPTVLSAVLTKNLLLIVLVGAISLAIIKDFIM